MSGTDFPLDLRGSHSELLRTYVRRRLHFLGSRMLGRLESATIVVLPGAPATCNLELVIDGRGTRTGAGSGPDVKIAFDLAVEDLLAGLGKDRRARRE